MSEVLIYKIAQEEEFFFKGIDSKMRLEVLKNAARLYQALSQSKGQSPIDTHNIILNEFNQFTNGIGVREAITQENLLRTNWLIMQMRLLEKYPTLIPTEMAQGLDYALRPYTKELIASTVNKMEIYQARCALLKSEKRMRE